jgi:hypothetical protein
MNDLENRIHELERKVYALQTIVVPERPKRSPVKREQELFAAWESRMHKLERDHTKLKLRVCVQPGLVIVEGRDPTATEGKKAYLQCVTIGEVRAARSDLVSDLITRVARELAR